MSQWPKDRGDLTVRTRKRREEEGEDVDDGRTPISGTLAGPACPPLNEGDVVDLFLSTPSSQNSVVSPGGHTNSAAAARGRNFDPRIKPH